MAVGDGRLIKLGSLIPIKTKKSESPTEPPFHPGFHMKLQEKYTEKSGIQDD